MRSRESNGTNFEARLLSLPSLGWSLARTDAPGEPAQNSNVHNTRLRHDYARLRRELAEAQRIA